MLRDFWMSFFGSRQLFMLVVSVSASFLQIQTGIAGELGPACYLNVTCLVDAATKDEGRVGPDLLGQYIAALARLGKFDLARSAARVFDDSSRGHFNRQTANEDIAIYEVVAEAISAPDKLASFSPIEALGRPRNEGPNFDLPSHLGLVVDVLLHCSPWAPMDTDLSNMFKPKTVRTSPNATLSNILTLRWPEAIEQLPSNKQGWHWNDVAKAWLELGDRNHAVQAVEHAEAVGWVDFQGVQRVYDDTWRTWILLGNTTRALQAVDRISEKSGAARFRIEIARSLVKKGERGKAEALAEEALSDARLEPNSERRMELLGEIVDFRLTAGDASGARAAAEQMASLAHQHSLIPAAQLAEAATAFDDLGDHTSAHKLLQEAAAMIPGNRQVIGTGVTLGPITGATLGLADSLKSQIAEELYRNRDLDSFGKLLQQMTPWYQQHTWIDLCQDRGSGRWVPPSEESCVEKAGNSVLISFAARAADKGEPDTANRLLRRAIAAYADSYSWEAVARLLDCARVAFVEGENDEVNLALIAAAKDADGLAGSGEREAALANVAALRQELVQ